MSWRTVLQNANNENSYFCAGTELIQIKIHVKCNEFDRIPIVLTQEFQMLLIVYRCGLTIALVKTNQIVPQIQLSMFHKLWFINGWKF